MAAPFIGEIRLMACTFAPKGWAVCSGQLLTILQNQALFAILGTTYGGNGTTNFALPDLRGRVPLHFGQGVGLSSNYVLGQVGGTESVPLILNQMPMHNHLVTCSSSPGVSADPTGAFPALAARARRVFMKPPPTTPWLRPWLPITVAARPTKTASRF